MGMTQWMEKQAIDELWELYVTAKPHLDIFSKRLLHQLRTYVWITSIRSLKIFDRYITQGFQKDFAKRVFSTAPVEDVYTPLEFEKLSSQQHIISFESNPGQFDQRVHASEMIGSIYWTTKVRHTSAICFEWDMSPEDLEKIKKYLINPQEKYGIPLENKKMQERVLEPDNYVTITGFIETDKKDIWKFLKSLELWMNQEDLDMVYDYFKFEEKRNPTKSEILAIDTYWSDHCRHTTFLTQIGRLDMSGNEEMKRRARRVIKKVKAASRKKWKKGNTFMETATVALSILKEDSDFHGTMMIDDNPENNAASYRTFIHMEDGSKQEWVIMFKNETHNSPTEIEPFGWAATCIGWAIRDPLSGRGLVFQAMRISWSSDPTEPLDTTLHGKLPQRIISLGAAFGFASYGNQIWLSAGMIREYFHSWFLAKRFECGFVVGWSPLSELRREEPKEGDVVIMIWKTGRDGVGGAKISSNAQGVSSKHAEGAHVQKWNAPEERKLQRLFSNPRFKALVKKSNDFGAGGIAVALGEISRGISVQLDVVPRKYSWLTDDELILSESQERMSFVIEKKDIDEMMKLIESENLSGVYVADVTNKKNEDEDRMVMTWNGHRVIDISRKFLDSNGASRSTKVHVALKNTDFFKRLHPLVVQAIGEAWNRYAILTHFSLKENASQRGLEKNFDESVGASTILARYGGKYQSSPQIGMAAKVPTFDGVDSLDAVVSTHAIHPYLTAENCYLWGIYAVLESVSKIVAMGGEREKTWLSLQEYFMKLKEEENWGEVYGMLLWALEAQLELKVAAIGGKDSASKTSKLPDGTIINGDPTIVSFANTTTESERVVSGELKKPWNSLLYFPVPKDESGLPLWKEWLKSLNCIQELTRQWRVFWSSVVDSSGLFTAIAKMSLWNRVWVKLKSRPHTLEFLEAQLGSIIIEVDHEIAKAFPNNLIGVTTSKEVLDFWTRIWNMTISEAQKALESPLEWLFPLENPQDTIEKIQTYTQRRVIDVIENPKPFPKVIIPVFEWTNSEEDTRHALIKAWFRKEDVIFHIFQTQTEETFARSRAEFAFLLEDASMMVFPGGFSASDEPAGSGKFIVETMKSPEIRESLQRFLDNKHTFTFGICNGFQALIKLWIFDDGKIKDELEEADDTLYYNTSLLHETGLWGHRVGSLVSPLMRYVQADDTFVIPESHGEGNFITYSQDRALSLAREGRIPFQYIDEAGNPTNKQNGSTLWIAGLTSPDGRIFWMMGHIERRGKHVFKNIPWEKHIPLFEAAYDILTGKTRNK